MSESEEVVRDPRGDGLREGDPREEHPAEERRRRRFDPRFSPAFQPGYDPRVHREAPPAAPLRGEPQRDWSLSGATVTAGRAAAGGSAAGGSAARRAPAGGASAARGVVRSAGASPRGDAAEALDEFPMFAIPEDRSEADEAVAEPEEADPVPWWRRVNPWFFVLWALGIAIVLFAFQFANLVFEGTFQPNPNDPSGYFVSMLPQLVIFGLPSVICLGLATFVTPFVILAARWRRA